MTSPSFKIMRLPSLAFDRVVEQMSGSELIQLSISSKKIASQVNWLTKKIGIIIEVDSFGLYLCFSYGECNDADVLWKNVKALETLSQHFKVHQISFLADCQDHRFIDLMEHAKELGVKICKASFSSCTNSETATRILNSCSKASDLQIYGRIENMSYDGFHNFSMDCLGLFSADWITVHHILQMGSIENIHLATLELVTDEDYSKIIEKWIACQLNFEYAKFKNIGSKCIRRSVVVGRITYERDQFVKRANGTLGQVAVGEHFVMLNVFRDINPGHNPIEIK